MVGVGGRVGALSSRCEGRQPDADAIALLAVAEANNCVVVTDNEREFEDIQVVNPIRRTT